jgi:hypothetical protein
MSDEPIRVTIPANENERPAGIHEHWCEHPGCNRWGSFGYGIGRDIRWLCGEHRPDGPVGED